MKGVWFDLKIHIVRKGDTLWEIAKQYGVDFEALKKSNPQLSSPDLIMPGMKIKIPSETKTVKKESTVPKETQTPAPKKETKKQTPNIKEDDHQKPKEVQMEMPKKHIPAIPPNLQTPKKEEPIVKEQHKESIKPKKETTKSPVKPMTEMIKMPVMEESTPETPKSKKPKKEEVKEEKPVSPICYHYYHHCCPPLFHHCMPVMNDMTGGFMPYHHMEQGNMLSPMPILPQQMGQPCGCQGQGQQLYPYQMREQIPMPGVHFAPWGHAHDMNESQFNPSVEEQPKPFPFPPPYPSYFEAHTREDRQTDDDQSVDK